ncbi:sensor domain-containing diguanylate cyclase [Vibrio diazotrophicus]|uniref:sensor domain-containing diguanylate cyclase n=1 Tax=Vibrio diazotrophicus TaxID=685 RepID=UPI00142D36BA|nr:GGDEF domain-containing protein [Vibrio diazotrophicus]NIY90936.1 GGDEF domain-containing protein [Vibrio diazotrophicus]
MGKDIIKFINTNRHLLDLFTDLIPIPIFVKDKDGRYTECNKAYMDFMSLERDQLIGKTVYDIWDKADADVFFAKDKELLDRGGVDIYETEITSPQGLLHAVQFHKQTFTDSYGAVAGLLGVAFDITERKRLEYSLADLASTDELTGLPNRREGMSRLEVMHKASERKDRPYCIAMVDIDHFKKVNDQYGHSVGDLVLKEFASLAKTILRINDVCFRYGGEEFVILLPETNLSDGLNVVERFRQTWATSPLNLLESQIIHSTASIGLVQYQGNNVAFERLIQLCDQALYDAKNGGRNCTVCVQPNQTFNEFQG